jgi:hypothetical protein
MIGVYDDVVPLVSEAGIVTLTSGAISGVTQRQFELSLTEECPLPAPGPSQVPL